MSKITRADIKVTMTFYPKQGTQCGYCGISSFSHRHKAGSLPKDFERIDDHIVPSDKKVDRHTDWEKKWDKLEKLIYYEKYINVGKRTCVDEYHAKNLVRELLADARKEVIEKVEEMINLKYPPYRFPEYTANLNVMTMSRGVAESTYIRRLTHEDAEHVTFLEHILATLKDEER